MATNPFLPQAYLPDPEDEEDEPSVASRRRCIGCRQLSPPTRSEHTLISAQHGWRLTRVTDEGTEPRLEWRCPGCWARYRQKKLGLP